MKRKLSLLLVLCLLFGCIAILSSCSTEEEESSTSNVEELNVSWTNGLDFKGITLNISQSVNLFDPVYSIDNAKKFTMATEPNNADTVLNACYERNEAVKNTLNLKVHYEPTDYDYAGIADYVTDVVVQSQPIDLIINDVIGVVPAAINGNLLNIKTKQLGGKDINNYFNFEHASWYDDYMEGLTVDKNKMYGLAGHYFMDVIRSAHCLYVNTEIFEDKCGVSYPEMDNFYKDIEDGLFTYDLFYDLIALGWEDGGRQGQTDADDQLGLVMHSGAGLYPFIFGSQISIFDYSGTEVTLKPNISEEVSLVAGKIHKIMFQNGTYCYSGSSGSPLTETFTSGGAMFVNTSHLGNLEHSTFQAMEKKAAIVYPKITEDYEYSTYVHDSAEIGYIPVNCQNFEAVSAYVQLLNEQSTPILTSYFENQIKYKYNTADSSAAIGMLDLINDTIGSPAYQFLEGSILVKEVNGTSLFNCIATAVRANNPNNAATLYQGQISAYQTGLTKLKQKFAQLP